MKVIDFHTHVFPVDTSNPSSCIEESIKRYLSGVDKTPVEKLVVCPGNGKLIAYTWDVLYPRMKNYQNVYFMITLAVDGNNNLDEDIERIKKLLKNPKVVGLKLYPGYDHFYPYDERLYELYSYLSRRRIPILFHSGETWEEAKEANPLYSHPKNFFKLAEEFPNLIMILAHVGYPWFWDVGELLLQFKNVYTDISDTLPEKTYRFFNINMEYVRKGILESISIAGDPRKFLFSTDWVAGQEVFKNYSKRFWYYYSFLNTLPVTEEELKDMTWRIAERLFFSWKD